MRPSKSSFSEFDAHVETVECDAEADVLERLVVEPGGDRRQDAVEFVQGQGEQPTVPENFHFLLSIT